MGHGTSKQGGSAGRKSARPSPLGDSEIIALKEARGHNGWSDDVSFEKLLLRLSTVGKGFGRVQDAFKQGSGTASTRSAQEAKQLLADLHLRATDEELHRYFETRERDEARCRICFADFLAAVAVVVLWQGPERAKSQGADADVVNAFVLALNSFNHFDKDGKGYLRREEVMQTLQEVDKPAHAPSRGGPPPTSPLQRRWEQMDWDADGCVQLREYLAALHAWALEDTEED